MRDEKLKEQQRRQRLRLRRREGRKQEQGNLSTISRDGMEDAWAREVLGDMHMEMEIMDKDNNARQDTNSTVAEEKDDPAVLEVEDYAEDDYVRGRSQDQDQLCSMPGPRPAQGIERFARRPGKMCPSPFQAGASRILEVGAHAREREALLFRKLEMHVEQVAVEKEVLSAARR